MNIMFVHLLPQRKAEKTLYQQKKHLLVSTCHSWNYLQKTATQERSKNVDWAVPGMPNQSRPPTEFLCYVVTIYRAPINHKTSK